ncbi:MAG: undecaprenyldiphospho-muramoylpentapeptide beta-N-acetylglucosaminyltransferase [Thermodesulfobacteriota bacterium]
MQRIILTTGGTGGHIFPALAVAEELRSRYPDCRILFLGAEQGPESKLAARAGLEFAALPVRGVLGKGWQSLPALLGMGKGLIKCVKIMGSFAPQAVLGFGGYAGFLPVLLASWKRIPCAVHEQNKQPGVTNKILGKRADRVFLTYPDQEGFFEPGKVSVTGNPVRRSLLGLRNMQKHYLHNTGGHLLVLGGSQGARAINDQVIKALPFFRSMGLRLMHITGPADLDRVRQAYKEQGCDPQQALAFQEDMAQAYAWADLVVCRAGASTLAELTVVGRPSVLIPFPYATHGHQLENARYLEKAGAAIVLEQSYLEDISLGSVVSDLMLLPQKLQQMGQAAKSLGSPGAGARIVDEIQSMLPKQQGTRL